MLKGNKKKRKLNSVNIKHVQIRFWFVNITLSHSLNNLFVLLRMCDCVNFLRIYPKIDGGGCGFKFGNRCSLNNRTRKWYKKSEEIYGILFSVLTLLVIDVICVVLWA